MGNLPPFDGIPIYQTEHCPPGRAYIINMGYLDPGSRDRIAVMLDMRSPTERDAARVRRFRERLDEVCDQAMDDLARLDCELAGGHVVAQRRLAELRKCLT